MVVRRADRDVADEGDAVQAAVVVRWSVSRGREVDGGSVVPEGDAAGLPAEAHGVFG